MARYRLPLFEKGDPLAGEDPLSSTVADYIHNLFVGTRLRRLGLQEINVIEDIELLVALVEAEGPRRRPRAEESGREALARGCRAYLRRHGTVPRHPRPPAESLGTNLATFQRLLGLDDVERDVLQFLALAHHSTDLRNLAARFDDISLPTAARTVGLAIDLPAVRVLAALGTSSRLLASGLISVDKSDGCSLANKFELKNGLLDLVLEPELSRDQIVARFLPEAPPATLRWDDFSHLEQPARRARDLLRAALRSRTPGVNILFCGPTGTGKTELARLLAGELGVKLYAAGLADDNGGSASASERLSSLLLGQRLVGDGQGLLLFDEVEDLFEWDFVGLFVLSGRRPAQLSKQWFNHLLESNPVPTIWISNRLRGVDEAFLRRFAFAVEFTSLGVGHRSRVLGRHLGPDSPLSAADIDAIAQRHQVSPGQLASAVAAARLLAPDGRPDRATIEDLLAPVEKLVTGLDPALRPVFEPGAFCIGALNSPDDLATIADRLAGWKPGARPGISLCLYGPPGTGKSEYVRYLAWRMGRRVVVRRGSDLLSKWVGETEQLIAQAFREAEADDAVLLFDEVDSFLRDRSLAFQKWEVSQVNELLQQLEASRGVVACTTNLWRDLDQAALRRFVFKIELRFLRPEQAVTLFRLLFADLLERPMSEADETLVAARLSRLATLTPGDFAAVARRQRALGGQVPASQLCELLRAECEVKRLAPRSAGFIA